MNPGIYGLTSQEANGPYPLLGRPTPVPVINAQAGVNFDPRDVPGLVIWLDANDPSTLTLSGQAVSEWRDKSGGNYHFTQTTGNNQPLYTGTLNGKPVVTFDGSNDSLSRAGINNLNVSGPDGASVFVVFRAASDTIYSVFVNGGSRSSEEHRDRFSDGNCYTGLLRERRILGVINNKLPSNGAVLFSAIATGNANYELRVGGASALLDTTNAFLIDPLGQTAYRNRLNRTYAIGVNPPLGDFLNGAVAEIIQYTRALAGQELSSVESYLKAKWGV